MRTKHVYSINMLIRISDTSTELKKKSDTKTNFLVGVLIRNEMQLIEKNIPH